VRPQRGLAPVYHTPLVFRNSFHSRHRRSPTSAGGTHTHGISAKFGHFTCAPTRFHELYRFHSLQFARISFSLYGSTNQVLFSGWDSQSHEVEGKKGGRCTAFATRHEEQLSQKEETTILYTPFSLMLEVQTGPMERAKSLGFFIMFQFWIPRFFVLFFFVPPRCLLACLSRAEFPYLYSPLFRIKD
jgi:hypothetical protein